VQSRKVESKSVKQYRRPRIHNLGKLELVQGNLFGDIRDAVAGRRVFFHRSN
jgi:hypothetical protein